MDSQSLGDRVKFTRSDSRAWIAKIAESCFDRAAVPIDPRYCGTPRESWRVWTLLCWMGDVMALISVAEYLKLREQEKSGKLVFGDTHPCAVCKTPIHESETGCREMGDGTYRCSDCYQDATTELEDFPILPPRVRRRA